MSREVYYHFPHTNGQARLAGAHGGKDLGAQPARAFGRQRRGRRGA